MMILMMGFFVKITLKKSGETSVTESIDITLSNAFLKKVKKANFSDNAKKNF